MIDRLEKEMMEDKDRDNRWQRYGRKRDDRERDGREIIEMI